MHVWVGPVTLGTPRVRIIGGLGFFPSISLPCVLPNYTVSLQATRGTTAASQQQYLQDFDSCSVGEPRKAESVGSNVLPSSWRVS